MSPQHETSAEALPLRNVVAEPLLRPARIAISQATAGAIAHAGRFGVIWLPAFALLSSPINSIWATVAVASIVSAVWFAVLHTSLASSRLTRFALGAPVGAAVGAVAGLIGVSALNVWLPGMGLEPMTLLQMAGAIFLLSTAWEAVVQSSVVASRRVLVVGAQDGGAELVEELMLAEDLPFEVIGVVDDERESATIAGVPLHGHIADLPEIVRAQKPDIVVLAGDQRSEAFNHLLEVASSGFKVVGLPQFYEHAFGRVPVRTVTPSWFMSVLHLYQRPYTRLAKRTFDVVVAAFGLLLVAWVFPILALLVKRTRGPVVFRQTRLGEGGKHFTIYKFRTMRQDAEVAGSPIWASERDPRITTIGRIMRRTRLDELPQLWNVLKGDMSIVGPRPERPEFLELLEETVPFWTRRHLVKPGITGWAQVRRGYTADAEGTADKLSYDLWYLRHRSLVVDLAIAIKTFTTLVSGSGAR